MNDAAALNRERQYSANGLNRSRGKGLRRAVVDS
jgi:hypothetical protein